jgi:hypothetical protein
MADCDAYGRLGNACPAASAKETAAGILPGRITVTMQVGWQACCVQAARPMLTAT